MSDAPLRILLAHESYASPGGEDEAVSNDADVLARHGHTVEPWFVKNDTIARWPLSRKARLLWQTTWSSDSYRRLTELARSSRPDVVHFHNTLPIISPSAIHAAYDLGLPVVMTLHNYRLLCPVGTFLRQGKICEDCAEHSLMRGVLHACYRRSRLQTTAVAGMLAVHRRMGTWRRCVDAYVTLTEFMRAKVVQGGLPPDKVHVRPNPVAIEEGPLRAPGDYALFIGRLSEEKGVRVLLEAFSLMPGLRLKVAGSGPLAGAFGAAAESLGGRLEILGQLSHHQAMAELRSARVLIFPSIWYESLGMVLLEAFASGVPVVASRLGAMAEILTDGREGFLFEPGNAVELAERVGRIVSDDRLRHEMSLAARRTFESRYSADRSYDKLMDIYRVAMLAARARRAVA